MITKNQLAGLLFAAAVAVASPAVAAGPAAAGPAGSAISATPAAGASAHGGTLNCSGLEALWQSAGGSPGAAFTAAEIAMAESSGQQYASNANTDGSTDRGYWQINSIHGSLSTYDALGNAKAAVIISHDGTVWSPWVTYQTGAYTGKC